MRRVLSLLFVLIVLGTVAPMVLMTSVLAQRGDPPPPPPPPPPGGQTTELEHAVTVNYLEQGASVALGHPSGLWNTQPAGFYFFSSDQPFSGPDFLPIPLGVEYQLPTPEQDVRGIYGSAALAEYGVMIYRCKKPENGGAANGCTGSDPDVHRFLWTGGCPGRAAMCNIFGRQLAGGIVQVLHSYNPQTALYGLRLAIHGAPGGPGPGVTDALIPIATHVYDGFTFGFVICSDTPYPLPGTCGPNYPGGREPLFGLGFTQTFHIATTRPSMNPACLGLSEHACMLSGIPTSFSALYLPHRENTPCILERGAITEPGITVCKFD